MRQQTICILGGSGFVGHHLACRLSRDGHHLRVLTRHPQRHRDLLLLPNTELVAAWSLDDASLREAFTGCTCVINLVGILNERGNDGSGFQRVHAELPARVANACRQAGVPRLLHMSALGARPEGPSHYLRTKAAGEAAVLAAEGLHVTALRPAVIFGPGDSFFNRFASLLRLTPYWFPLACPDALMQPVYVGDVADVFARTLDLPETYGHAYDLCGPRTYRLRELVEFTARTLKLRRKVVGLGDRLSRIQARLFDHLPGKPFSTDNYLSLQVPGVCAQPFPPIFKLKPASIEAVVPTYLHHADSADPYDIHRRTARRE